MEGKLNLRPEAIMASPEKAELVAAIREAKIAAWLDEIRPAENEHQLQTLLEYIGRKEWFDGGDHSPNRWVKLDAGQVTAFRDVAARALASRGRGYVMGPVVWPSLDGKRLRMLLPI
jgi:hypothetical protein